MGTIVNVVSCVAAIAAVVVALYLNYDSKLPDVAVYLEHDRDHSCISLIIKNFGQGIAHNVKLRGFDYSIADSRDVPLLKSGFIERGIPMLVPGASRDTVIQAGASMREHREDSCTVTISYEEKAFPFGTKTVSRPFVLDYYSFSGSLYTISDVHGIRIELAKIEEAIRAAR